jgi:hypothetical protein
MKQHGALRLILLAFLAIAALAIPVHVLEVRGVKEDRAIVVRRVVPGSAFSLGFIHSVEKTPVRDFYRIDDSYRIVQRETIFSSCNTGLPVTLAERETLLREGNHFRVTGMGRVCPEILLWVDEPYNNTLIFGDEGVVRLALPDAGPRLLRVAVKQLTTAGFLYERIAAGVYGLR